MKHPARNILFTTWEGGGNIPPVLTVARQLRERGHRVRLMSDHVNRADAEANSLVFHPWQSAPSRKDRTPDSCPLRDWEAASPRDGINRLLERMMFGAALDYARDLSAVLDEEPADLVVTSEMLMGVLAGCESRGQRVAILAANLCIYPFEDMPSFGPGLPPPCTDEERELHRHIRSGTLAMLNSHLDTLNRARIALGLMPLDCVLKQLNAAERHLLATSRAFDFLVEKLPPGIRYVGPQLDEPGWTQPWSLPWPADDLRPLVLVGFSSTYQAHEGVLQKIVDAAAELPARVLVTLGRIAPDAVRPAPNTVIVQSAPHNTVMLEASLVVTHGGHGTVMRALKHHLPMLVIPHGRDQDENAVRVVEHGAELRLTAESGTTEIRGALRMLLEDASFAAAARRLGSAIADAAGHEDAVAELENLAAVPACGCCKS